MFKRLKINMTFNSSLWLRLLYLKACQTVIGNSMPKFYSFLIQVSKNIFLHSDVVFSRWPVCLVHSGNYCRNQITWLPLLSWGNHHHSPRCEFFYSNSGILTIQSGAIVGVNLAGIYAEKKIAVYRENSSCRNHKNTKKRQATLLILV